MYMAQHMEIVGCAMRTTTKVTVGAPARSRPWFVGRLSGNNHAPASSPRFSHRRTRHGFGLTLPQQRTPVGAASSPRISHRRAHHGIGPRATLPQQRTPVARRLGCKAQQRPALANCRCVGLRASAQPTRTPNTAVGRSGVHAANARTAQSPAFGPRTSLLQPLRPTVGSWAGQSRSRRSGVLAAILAPHPTPHKPRFT